MPHIHRNGQRKKVLGIFIQSRKAHPLSSPFDGTPWPNRKYTRIKKKKKTIIKILASVSFFLSNLLQVLHLFICSTGFSFFHEPSQTQIFIRCPSSSQPSSIFAFRRMESTSSSQVDSVYKLGASNFPPKVHTLTWRNGAKGHLISSPLHLFCASTALMQHRKQGWACEALVGLRWWCLHRVAGEDWHICEGEKRSLCKPFRKQPGNGVPFPWLWHIKAPAKHPGNGQRPHGLESHSLPWHLFSLRIAFHTHLSG